MKTHLYITAAVAAFAGLTAVAQDMTPQIVMPVPGKQVLINKISDNGEWAVSETAGDNDGDIRPVGGTLYNMSTFEAIPVAHETGIASVADVTDDGRIVVGSCNDKPAYFEVATGEWTLLPIPEGFDIGSINSVTPDGHYAAGYFSTNANRWSAYPALYDLQKKEVIKLNNVPKYDMQHVETDQNVFYEISADGRYLLGYMSMSYWLPPQVCCYVYDRETESADFIGFTPDDTKAWTPEVPYTYLISAPAMSPNGEWVTGQAYMVQPIAGSDFPQESTQPFIYNVKEKTIQIFTQSDAASIGGFSIGNDGFLYGAGPSDNPYPTAMLRSGNYFVSLEQVLAQAYGVDYNAVSGFDNSGKVISASADGKTLVVMPDLYQTYILKLQEPLANAVGSVKLLADYTVSPAAGVALSRLSTITLTFQRSVAVKGRYTQITFASTDGTESYNPVASNGFVAEGNKVTFTFRSRDLNPEKEYVLTVPAGAITMAGDAEVTNDEIKVLYSGRANTPVKLESALPADESVVTYFDLTGNPLLLTFDTDLKLGDNAVAYLYRNDDEVATATLSVLVNGKQALVYPPVRQNLSEGSEYTVVIPAGTLTDIAGGGPNEEIILHYSGSYVPEVNSDDIYLFNEDCNSTDNFLFYEGDHNSPDPIAVSWGFNKDTTPWSYVRDEDSTDMALGSHSMYTPRGQADDWMLTAQLYIPDEKCYLNFDAQSYLIGCEDRLKIYIYETEDAFSTLTSEIIDRIRQNGKLVFDELLDPGPSEDLMAGEWTNYTITLEEYSGKPIYICFLNENLDQSAIFIDNIKVVHDTPFVTSFDTPERVINQSTATVKGTVLIASDIAEFESIKLELLDADRNSISTIEESGLNLKKDANYNFEFPVVLSLEPAVVNRYSVKVTLDDLTSEYAREVRNLTFAPSRKIVLEEFTGRDCANCPLGIRAVENIQELYPERLIPICIRTYSSDPLGTGVAAYSNFLGMNAAPSGRINRGYISMPMVSNNQDYMFSGAGLIDSSGLEPLVWLDYFRQAVAESCDLDIAISSTLNEEDATLDVAAEVKSAINLDRTSYNIFAVVVENNLETYQLNGFSMIQDPDLGDWGFGGLYAQGTVYPYYAMDVARTTWGNTFNGTPGMIPSDLKADQIYSSNFTISLPQTISNYDNCEVVVMVVNAGNGRVVNANICKLNGHSVDFSGIESIEAEGVADVEFSVSGDVLTVSGSQFDFQAVDLSGMTVAAGKGNGTASYRLNGYKGVLLVKAADAAGNVRSAKILVK
ncbi:MAG: Omp28-related outer membrane protein [Muribaculaceae bacterium]|nr:Omp28-related outer membrane protein [Muribaculaceae bacterium]